MFLAGDRQQRFASAQRCRSGLEVGRRGLLVHAPSSHQWDLGQRNWTTRR